MLHVDLREIFEYAQFKIYGEWSVQASKQASIHTHVRNAVTLVWGSLRLAPTTACVGREWEWGWSDSTYIVKCNAITSRWLVWLTTIEIPAKISYLPLLLRLQSMPMAFLIVHKHYYMWALNNLAQVEVFLQNSTNLLILLVALQLRSDFKRASPGGNRASPVCWAQLAGRLRPCGKCI